MNDATPKDEQAPPEPEKPKPEAPKLEAPQPEKPVAETSAGNPDANQHGNANLWKLVLGCVGVVYGDIGTSPLYALRESLRAADKNGATPEEVIGVVSLLLWTLILIVTIKYVSLVMRADNRGEGGTLTIKYKDLDQLDVVLRKLEG